MAIEMLAPAKVNLFLKVLNKRKDSYHNILTVFEKVSLADKIKLSKISKGILVASNRFITRSHKDNLAFKAAKAILKHEGIKTGVKIEIEKKIPIRGGLGGGSSDAAAVLLGMDRLFDLKLKKERLMRIASKLGSDVPFFISDTPFAIGRARGDKVEAIDSEAILWHMIVYPGFGLSTKEVYESFDTSTSKDLTRKFVGAKIDFPLRHSMDFGVAGSMLYNELEGVVISKREVVGKIIRRLASSLGKKAILSGSGPSLFCLYRTRKEAARDKARFLKIVPARERKGWRVFIVRTARFKEVV